jgi:hypothetical protein
MIILIQYTCRCPLVPTGSCTHSNDVAGRAISKMHHPSLHLLYVAAWLLTQPTPVPPAYFQLSAPTLASHRYFVSCDGAAGVRIIRGRTFIFVAYQLVYYIEHCLSEANSRSASQEIFRLLWNPKIHCRVPKSQPLVHIMCQMDLYLTLIFSLSSTLFSHLFYTYISKVVTCIQVFRLMCPMRATWPAHLILDFIILITFKKDYALLSLPSYNFLHLPVTSSRSKYFRQNFYYP